MDAEAALRAGGDHRIGLFGPGVDTSHSYQRIHRDALGASTRLLLAYLLNQTDRTVRLLVVTTSVVVCRRND
jgi:putative aminopeptidase FrvX